MTQDQVQKWLAILVSVGALGVFIQAGRALGRIEEKVDTNSERAASIGTSFVGHVSKADQGFKDIAKLVSDLDARMSKQEGREEERSRH